MKDVHPLLAAAFRALDESGARWCLLRGRGRLVAPDGDVDLLFTPADARLARGALQRAGFVRLRSWAGGTQNFFLGYDRDTDHWIYLHAVTSLDFGAWHALRYPGGVDGVLGRRGEEDGVPMPSPDDRFWITLLHALLDKGAVASKHREALGELAGRARADGDLGRFVTGLLAPGEGADALLAAAVARDWSVLEGRAPALAAGARRSDRGAWLRRIRHRASLAVAKLRETVTRRGVATAMLAPDGAGKSTVIESLDDALFFRVKHYYLGLEGGRFAGKGRSRLPAAGLLRRLGYAWSVWLRSRADLSRRRLVLFDRYPYEGLLPPVTPLGTLSRWRRGALARALPPPHLVVVLDAPGQVLHARKAEHPVERLEHDRQGYLDLARRRGWVVVDATKPAIEVRRDVTEAIWHAYRRRVGKH